MSFDDGYDLDAMKVWYRRPATRIASAVFSASFAADASTICFGLEPDFEFLISLNEAEEVDRKEDDEYEEDEVYLKEDDEYEEDVASDGAEV